MLRIEERGILPLPNQGDPNGIDTIDESLPPIDDGEIPGVLMMILTGIVN